MTAKPTGGRASFGPGFWREALAIVAAALILELAQGLGARWFGWYPSELNPAFAEGREWWAGRLDIPDRILDTAYDPATGRIYNAYPPLLSIISFVAHAPLPGRAQPISFPEYLPLLLFGLPLPIIGYWAFSRLTRGPWWPAIMTLGWLGGTAMIGVTRLARNCDIYHLNHILAQYGLLLMTVELLTRRRMWVMMLGLGIAAWTRQLAILFMPAVLAAAWWWGDAPPASGQSDGSDQRQNARPDPSGRRVPAESTRRSRMMAFVVGMFLIAVVPIALSWAKFGRPWRSGYELLYLDLNPELYERVRNHGLFSTAFAARNAYFMNVDIPGWEWVGWRPRPLPSVQGTSMWYTSPILALIWLGLPAWWRDPARRTLMLCSLAVLAGHICYHTSGETAAGYYRFALDYIPVWMAVAAGWLTTGWRRWATLACFAWSVTYFGLLYA